MLGIITLLTNAARSDVKPNNLFSDHMVLQAGVSVPIWGTASPGEQITVTIDDQKQSTTAADSGKWMIHLSNLQAGGPLEMTIGGTNTITIHDVLVGQVWLASGQSNMQFSVGPSPTVKAYNGVVNMEQEIAAANYPLLRMYTVKPTLSAKPLDDTQGQWEVCTPDTVKSFSAIGYFFARDLQKEIAQPVGIINSSYGASTAEAWISKSAMNADDQLAGLMKNFQTAVDSYAARAATLPATEPTTRSARARGPRDPYHDQHNPTVLWNAMLKPLEPYAIRGVIWYQGESVLNGTAGDKLYPTVMETLVRSWRNEWDQGDFPFYVCQLAGQNAASNNPFIRESQAAILSLPNTGMAVTIDIGEMKNVHPKNKQDVGDRLSRIALAKVYGKPIEYSGQVYDSMKVEDHSIRLAFTHIGGGLVAKDGPLETFMIAGSDGQFKAAQAKIDGDSVVVSSLSVPNPVAVRYAWMSWPEGCNFYNAAGLPAAPFRTDQQPGATIAP
jgi:sialate O-acetylesterase